MLSTSYPLQVDYSRSIEDSLRTGHYTWVNYQITSSNFPGGETGRGALSVVLVPFSPRASLDFIVGREAAAGLRPATLKELLSFAATYPDVQRTLPVLALGSAADLLVPTYVQVPGNGMVTLITEIVRRVERLYPFLSGGLPGRTVNLDWLDDPAGYGMYYACFVKSQ